jgi:glycosyltransferase involved in cell wall biosynthesis
MNRDRPTYAVVTPARNEAQNLLRLAACLDRQTLPPAHWVIVDNGSSDDTMAVACSLAETRPWLHVAAVQHLQGFGDSVRGGPVTRAFHAGYAAIDGEYDVVVKLDADVSFGDDFFAVLVRAFENPRLGIASGTCYELDDGLWTQRHVTGSSAWGATRAYRAACLEFVMPLEERMGWDGIDELKARLRGWETRTLLDLPFLHHRAEGERDGSRWRAWSAGGRGAYYMGYRWWYLVARALFNLRNEMAALAMVPGYFGAAARREKRCEDPQVIAFLRQQQTVSNLPQRFREAAGRHSSAASSS